MSGFYCSFVDTIFFNLIMFADFPGCGLVEFMSMCVNSACVLLIRGILSTHENTLWHITVRRLTLSRPVVTWLLFMHMIDKLSLSFPSFTYI